MSFHETRILAELAAVFAGTDTTSVPRFVQEVQSANRVVCIGAGRVGLALTGFAKRLMHLGKEAFWINDSTLPKLGSGDLMVVGSGSGETESVLSLVQIAKRNGLRIALVTSEPASSMATISDTFVALNCPSKVNREGRPSSIQPMTTLFEQACQVFLDALVLEIMESSGISAELMEERHNVIE